MDPMCFTFCFSLPTKIVFRVQYRTNTQWKPILVLKVADIKHLHTIFTVLKSANVRKVTVKYQGNVKVITACSIVNAAVSMICKKQVLTDC
jgi:hypothetical protein